MSVSMTAVSYDKVTGKAECNPHFVAMLLANGFVHSKTPFGYFDNVEKCLRVGVNDDQIVIYEFDAYNAKRGHFNCLVSEISFSCSIKLSTVMITILSMMDNRQA